MDIKKAWRKPNGELPDGSLLVEIETIIGSDINLVTISDEDNSTLLDANESPWGNWTWGEVTRYVTLDELLPPLETIGA